MNNIEFLLDDVEALDCIATPCLDEYGQATLLLNGETSKLDH